MEIRSVTLLCFLSVCKATESSLPESGMDSQTIKEGGFVLYVFGIAYILLGVREVCSEHFMPVIDFIVDKYSIKPDVAGASLMAMGGSAPELFISFIGVFLARSNIGLATILGSGAFNAMLLVGICAMSAKTSLELQWWQVGRDFFFYVAILSMLIGFTYDYSVAWWEGMLMAFVYFLYAYFMKHNTQIEKFVKMKLNLPYEGDEIDFCPLPTKEFLIRRNSVEDLKEYFPKTLHFDKGVLAKIKRNQERVERSNSEKAVELQRKLKNSVYTILKALEEKNRCEKSLKKLRGITVPYEHEDFYNSQEQEPTTKLKRLRSIAKNTPQETTSEVTQPKSLYSRVRHWVLFPIKFLLKVTIPNTETYPKYCLVSFVNCLVWIGVFSFFLVWWSLDVGSALGIADSIIGILLLAGGVSIPDLINTLRVTLDGHGDMALSGSLGSNILNLTVGLGLPWFFNGVFVGDFEMIDNGLFIAEIFLISLVGVSYTFVAGFKWQLSRNLGGVMFFFYFTFLALFFAFELN